MCMSVIPASVGIIYTGPVSLLYFNNYSDTAKKWIQMRTSQLPVYIYGFIWSEVKAFTLF